MIPIHYPEDKVKTRQGANSREIFDPVRKKWLLLTPEEWVRQHFVAYLHFTKNYPISLMAIEKEFFLGELKKRADIVVYSRAMQPFMIIECKEMNTPLTGKVLEQALRYHLVLQPQYLLITNGSYCHGFAMQSGAFGEINIFPEYSA